MKFTGLTLNEKKKLVDWLRTAAYYSNVDEDEINQTCYRLDREIAYEENFSSDEYTKQSGLNPEDMNSDGIIFGDNIRKQILEIYATKKADSLKQSIKLIQKGHTNAIKKMAENGGLVLDYEEITDLELKEFHQMFINYLHEVATDKDDHKLYNDKVDYWYFNLKDTDRKFETDPRHFITEIYILRYGGYEWEYSETNGQGKLFTLSVLTADRKNKLMKIFGLTEQELEDKFYDVGVGMPVNI